MAHFSARSLTLPSHFNFARDVVDYWACESPSLQAMLWASPSLSTIRSLSYSHFSQQSRRIAVLLQKLGIRRGDRVLVVLPRLPEWWELAVAALRAGIVICPATTLLVGSDIEFRAKQTGAVAFVGDEVSVEKFLKVRNDCPKVKYVILVGETKTNGKDVVDFRDELGKILVDVEFEAVDTKAVDPAIIYFTSGTSGPPKMVQHNHVSYPLAHTVTGKFWLQLSPGKLYWNLSEQGWAKAAWSFFGAWNCGASLFVHDDRKAFKATNLLDILHRFPITTLCAPPTAYRQLVLQEQRKYLAATPPKALLHCTGAGEPLNDSVIKAWEEMTGLQIYDGYGQSETILVCGNFKGTKIKPGSMGKPTPGVPLAVVNSDGEECESGVEGDIGILINSNKSQESDFFGIFDGYLDKEGRLDQRVRDFGARKWYLTGDRATRDKDGYLWFVGRSDDVINSSGYRIGPFEVESTLKQHPGVVESAVVSSPDVNRGEVVKAFVVLTAEFENKARSDTEALIKDLQDFCKENAAPYKYPRKVEFVDATYLPKTISGKIKRNELKAKEWEQRKSESTKSKL